MCVNEYIRMEFNVHVNVLLIFHQIKSQYSLLLPDYSPEIFDSEKKTDSNV